MFSLQSTLKEKLHEALKTLDAAIVKNERLIRRYVQLGFDIIYWLAVYPSI